MFCINSGVWKMLWLKRTCSSSKAQKVIAVLVLSTTDGMLG